MKQCPKCQSTYTDDSLGYCLQDGTSLHNIKDILASADTLEMRIEPTQSIGIPFPTTTEEQKSSPPAVIADPTTSKTLVRGVFLIAALLAALLAITSALLVRSYISDRDRPRRQRNGNERADVPGTPGTLTIIATASTTRKPLSGNTYYPANLIDENLASAWIEGDDGPGRGSWVQFDFDREITLNSIKVFPGYFKSQPIWAKNNRVSVATIAFSDASSLRANFSDQMQPQDVAAGGIRTRSVRLTIDEFYGGTTDFNDTAISEVKFDWKP